MPQAPKLSPIKLDRSLSPKKVLPPGLKLTPPLHLEVTNHKPQTVSYFEARIYTYHIRTNLTSAEKQLVAISVDGQCQHLLFCL